MRQWRTQTLCTRTITRRSLSEVVSTTLTGTTPTGPQAGRRAAIVRLALFAGAAVGISLAGDVALKVRVNFTRSLPLGLYRTVQARAISRGSIVLVCLPGHIGRFARERGYLWRGVCPGTAAPVGKLVLAVPGDTVRLTESGFRVNGQLIPHTAPMTADSRGRVVTHYPYGSYNVAQNEIWLYSPFNRRSFDSRYFGPILTVNVQRLMLPLWTAQPRW